MNDIERESGLRSAAIVAIGYLRAMNKPGADYVAAGLERYSGYIAPKRPNPTAADPDYGLREVLRWFAIGCSFLAGVIIIGSAVGGYALSDWFKVWCGVILIGAAVGRATDR